MITGKRTVKVEGKIKSMNRGGIIFRREV